MGFVDIHSHILPGIDDGARTMEESVAMLRVAADSGTSDIVATPHANSRYPYDRQVAQQLCDQLQETMGDAIRIHLGCDFHLSFDNIKAVLADPARFAVNGAGYLLVEFSDMGIPPGTGEVFRQLQASGLIPVVTHPERNAILRRSVPQLHSWVDAGAYLQVTGQSLLGDFGREARDSSMSLIRDGLVHFVASDGHDPDSRPPRLDRTFEFLTAEFGEPYARLLVEEFPQAVVEGISLPRAQKPRTTTRWYEFWR